MTILNEGSHSDVFEWLPDGNGFVVKDKKKCLDEVLSVYFGISKYPSFTRRLKRWEFIHHQQGHKTACYFHPLFRKRNPTLCLDMRCNPQKKYCKNGHKESSTQLNPSGRKSLSPNKQSIYLPPPPLLPRTETPCAAAPHLPFPNGIRSRTIQAVPEQRTTGLQFHTNNCLDTTTVHQNHAANTPNLYLNPGLYRYTPTGINSTIFHTHPRSFPVHPNPHFSFHAHNQFLSQLPSRNGFHNHGYQHAHKNEINFLQLRQPAPGSRGGVNDYSNSVQHHTGIQSKNAKHVNIKRG